MHARTDLRRTLCRRRQDVRLSTRTIRFAHSEVQRYNTYVVAVGLDNVRQRVDHAAGHQLVDVLLRAGAVREYEQRSAELA